jgi:hypothetical protein
MEYIEPKLFLEQPKEVQKVFLDWWLPEIRDLFFRDFRRENDGEQFLRGIYIGCILDNGTLINAKRSKESSLEYAPFSPVFTEGQLRKFIEDKTYCRIDTTYFKDEYCVDIYDGNEWEIPTHSFNTGTLDLLQAYWQVACKIAKEGLNDN